MNAIEVNGIYKYYGTLCALNDVKLSVPQNCIYGIIGADGAGKSTLFRILTTLMLPDNKDSNQKPNKKDSIESSGKIFEFDLIKDYKKIRQIIGYMPNNFSLYADLSVGENLEFFASIFNVSIKENYDLIEPIFNQLKPFYNRRAGALSGGMKQKLALSCALIHKPKILFLDEPTTGVDALSRQEFWGMLSSLKSQITIIVSTPNMDEASLCDIIALIANGKILNISTPYSLIESYPRNLYELQNVPVSLLESIRALPSVHSCFLFGASYHITFKDSDSTQKGLDSIKALCDNEVTLQEIKPSIEDCFMEYLL